MIYHIYVGSYMGENGGDGIYLLKLDSDTGTLERIASYPQNSDNPSFLSVNQRFVYAVSEGMQGGKISAFSRDGKTGQLQFLNQISTKGTAMCHLTLWPQGDILSAANYMSGSLLTARLHPEGTLDRLCDFKQHTGVGFERVRRQEGPHVHATGISPDGKRLYAADLGLDQVFCYRIGENGMLTLEEDALQIRVPGGEGPRHFVFSDDGRYFYLCTEMGSKLFVFESKGGSGHYQQIQSISALPEGYEGFNLGADIHFSRDKRFLYVSCRGRDCITAFRVLEDGTVETVDYYSCGGSFPRNFCVTPDDQYLLIANQHSGNVVLCPRDPHNGAVGEKIAEISIPQAVYVCAIEKG